MKNELGISTYKGTPREYDSFLLTPMSRSEGRRRKEIDPATSWHLIPKDYIEASLLTARGWSNDQF